MAAEAQLAPEPVTEVAPVRASPEPRAPEPTPAPDAPAAKDKKAKKAADKKGKGEKGKGEKGAPAPPGDGPSIAAHPRAVRSVARAKSWAGLLGFLIGGYLSMPTHTLAQAGLRALAAGVICYVVAWGAAVFAWRRLIALEIRAREQQLADALAAGAGEPAQGAGAAR